MSKHLARLALAAALALGATAARAGTANATMNVSANVISNCTISAADLAFGDYDPVDVNATADLSTSADLTLVCTKKANVTVRLQKNPLVQGSSVINYSLYSDAGHTTAWEGTVDVAAVGKGKVGETLTVYGVIPAGQEPDVGVHNGTIVATVTF